MNKTQLKKLIQYLKKNASYNTYEEGYYSLNINGCILNGQRNCEKRVEKIIERFVDKNVLDFGCNIGGMLLTLSPFIRNGIGFDNHIKYINVANRLTKVSDIHNLNFYTFDIDKESFEDINHFIPQTIDICMILSIGKWIKRWKELIDYCLNISNIILYETNGHNQKEQLDYLISCCDVEIIEERSLDDKLQHDRKLVWCVKKGDV